MITSSLNIGAMYSRIICSYTSRTLAVTGSGDWYSEQLLLGFTDARRQLTEQPIYRSSL